MPKFEICCVLSNWTLVIIVKHCIEDRFSYLNVKLHGIKDALTTCTGAIFIVAIDRRKTQNEKLVCVCVCVCL